MNAVARTGAYVSVAALSIAGIYGLSTPSLIAGSTGVIATLLKSLYDAYEVKREARRSSMHFVWRLSTIAPR